MVPYLFAAIIVKIKSPLLNFARRSESYNFGIASLIPKKKKKTVNESTRLHFFE